MPLNRPLTIGRHASCDVRLPEPTVSRRHAVVSIVGGRPLVDATMSTNGISLDCGRANHAILAIGRTFTIGSTIFRIVGGSPVAAQATPGKAYLPAAARSSVILPGQILPIGRNPRTPGRTAPPFAAVGAFCLVPVLAVFLVAALAGGPRPSGGAKGLASSAGTGQIQPVGLASDSPLAVPSAAASVTNEGASTPATVSVRANPPAATLPPDQAPSTDQTPVPPSAQPLESFDTPTDAPPVPAPTDPGGDSGPGETPVPPPAASSSAP